MADSSKKGEATDPVATKLVTVTQLKTFILHEGKGVSLMDGSIELPDTAVCSIIDHYLERYEDAGIDLVAPDLKPSKSAANPPGTGPEKDI